MQERVNNNYCKNIGGGCKSSPLLIAWRGRGELLANSLPQGSISSQKTTSPDSSSNTTVLCYNYTAGWGGRASEVSSVIR